MFKIAKARWPELWQALAREGQLYLPALVDGKTDFTPWQKDTKVDLLTAVTAKSLKHLFFAQVEPLMDFQTSGKKVAVTPQKLPEQPTIAFGVRACDLAGFAILDKVFLKEPVDTFYRARREHCTLIGLACGFPEETCFCHTFDIDAASPAGDVQTWLVWDNLYWESQTEKGRQLTAKLAALFTEATAADKKLVQDQQAKIKETLRQLPLGQLRFSPELAKHEQEVFNSKVWEQLAATCLSCCGCTYVCPTCHCYDVRDNVGKDGQVQRFRCWDSCMNGDFTKMAHGNPRKGQLERFRQRYMHKLVYFPEDYEGTFACVGCGRCLRICPVNLNIVKVAKALEVDLHV